MLQIPNAQTNSQASQSSAAQQSFDNDIQQLMDVIHSNVQSGSGSAQALASEAYAGLITEITPENLRFLSSNKIGGTTWYGFLQAINSNLKYINGNGIPNLALSKISSKLNNLVGQPSDIPTSYNLSDVATRFDTPGGFAHSLLQSIIPNEKTLDRIGTVLRTLNLVGIGNNSQLNADYSKVINDLQTLPNENEIQQVKTLSTLSTHISSFADELSQNGTGYLPSQDKTYFGDVVSDLRGIGQGVEHASANLQNQDNINTTINNELNGLASQADEVFSNVISSASASIGSSATSSFNSSHSIYINKLNQVAGAIETDFSGADNASSFINDLERQLNSVQGLNHSNIDRALNNVEVSQAATDDLFKVAKANQSDVTDILTNLATLNANKTSRDNVFNNLNNICNDLASNKLFMQNPVIRDVYNNVAFDAATYEMYHNDKASLASVKSFMELNLVPEILNSLTNSNFNSNNFDNMINTVKSELPTTNTLPALWNAIKNQLPSNLNGLISRTNIKDYNYKNNSSALGELNEAYLLIHRDQDVPRILSDLETVADNHDVSENVNTLGRINNVKAAIGDIVNAIDNNDQTFSYVDGLSPFNKDKYSNQVISKVISGWDYNPKFAIPSNTNDLVNAVLNRLVPGFNSTEKNNFNAAVNDVISDAKNQESPDLTELWNNVRNTPEIASFLGNHGPVTKSITSYLNNKNNADVNELNDLYHQLVFNDGNQPVPRILNDLENVANHNQPVKALADITATVKNDKILSNLQFEPKILSTIHSVKLIEHRIVKANKAKNEPVHEQHMFERAKVEAKSAEDAAKRASSVASASASASAESYEASVSTAAKDSIAAARHDTESVRDQDASIYANPSNNNGDYATNETSMQNDNYQNAHTMWVINSLKSQLSSTNNQNRSTSSRSSNVNLPAVQSSSQTKGRAMNRSAKAVSSMSADSNHDNTELNRMAVNQSLMINGAKVTRMRKNYGWFEVSRTCLAHNTLGSVGRVKDYGAVLSAGMKVRLNKIFRVNVDHRTLYRYEINISGHNYFVTGNHEFTNDVYYQTGDLKGHRVHGRYGHRYFEAIVKKPFMVYDDYHFTKDNQLWKSRRGQLIDIKGVHKVGNVTRLALIDGTYITANREFLKLI